MSTLSKRQKLNFIWLALFATATVLILVNHEEESYFKVSGLVFGTSYNITYEYTDDLKQDIVNELRLFDHSLSPFNPSSVITAVNKNKDTITDHFFQTCFKRAMEISEATDGAFDITVAPLVNAWGFGFKEEAFPDSAKVDSMLQFTGYQKVKMTEGRVIKDDPRLMLDCSAVAKGYAVDVIADLLASKGIENYLVDIGGEIVAKGVNARKSLWRIGINKPVDDSLSVSKDMQAILKLSDAGMATSGNYRNYYTRDGKKYAHTIDPRTGYPIQHSLLSATVIAKDCMTADALATAFMVVGLDKAKAFAEKDSTIDVFFIYSDDNGKYQTYHTEGMERYLIEK